MPRSWKRNKIFMCSASSFDDFFLFFLININPGFACTRNDSCAIFDEAAMFICMNGLQICGSHDAIREILQVQHFFPGPVINDQVGK